MTNAAIPAEKDLDDICNFSLARALLPAMSFPLLFPTEFRRGNAQSSLSVARD